MARRLADPSPCCSVRSEVRFISVETNEMIFRCSKCAQLRIEPIARGRPSGRPGLRLVHSR